MNQRPDKPIDIFRIVKQSISVSKQIYLAYPHLLISLIALWIIGNIFYQNIDHIGLPVILRILILIMGWFIGLLYSLYIFPLICLKLIDSSISSGKHISIREILRALLKKIFPCIFLTLLITLLLVVPIGIILFPMVFFGTSNILAFIGVISLAIMVLYVANKLYLTYPLIIIKNNTVINSIGKSWRLTKGYWWRMFISSNLLFILLLVTYSIIYGALYLLTGDSLFTAYVVVPALDGLLSSIFALLLCAIPMIVLNDIISRNRNKETARVD